MDLAQLRPSAPGEARADGAAYPVVLEVFEGPLDLLLTLIRREQLDITSVALAQVTDQYLAHLSRLEAIDAGAIAEFCEVAASLMLIKSRALLPRTVAPDDETDEDAQALVEQLRAYRRFKQVAEDLGHRERAGLRAFVRTAPPPDLKPEIKPGEASVADLAAAFEAALAQLLVEAEPEAAAEPPVERRQIRLGDRFREIRGLLASRGRVSFREILLGERRDREFVIVSFLAVLELLRRRFIRAVQTELFGDIDLEARPEAEGWQAAELGEHESFLDEAPPAEDAAEDGR